MVEDTFDRVFGQWARERPQWDLSAPAITLRISRLALLQSGSFAAVMAPFGLTFGEYEVLAVLVRSGAPHRLKPGELVDALFLSSGAMTNRIDRLEAAGLIERNRDPDDRRSTFVALSAAGRRVFEEAALAHLANEERLVAGLSADERRQLITLLRKLLVSEPYAALDPAYSENGKGSVSDTRSRFRTYRRR